MADFSSPQRLHTYCALCIARCGAVAVVENGRFTRLEPDPGHPTGQALCAKGRAAPELVYHPERLTRPLRRTRPKGDPDPGWEPIGWDAALDQTAAAMRRAMERYGPQAVAFTLSSPSTTAIGDSSGFIQRLANALGTPNAAITLDVCGWGRGFATRYTFGVGSVGVGGGGAMPDIANSGCMILWGYNPSYTRITHATAVVEALKRGMRLIVIDPRHVGLANKADLWLRVRPGTDGALALGIANLMIERGWYDRDFIRDWSNGPLLVRADTGRLLTERNHGAAVNARRNFAWDGAAARLVPYDTATGRYDGDGSSLALEGEYRIATAQGEVVCHPVFELYTRLCRRYPPEAVEAICLDPARSGRGSGKPDLARAPGVLLRLERPRAARQRHADGARDVVALCADRKLRPARRECAVPGGGVRADHRPGTALGAGHDRDLGTCGAPTRSGAMGLLQHQRSLPGNSRR